MLTHTEFLSCLIYFAASYPAMMFAFRDDTVSPRKCLYVALTFIVTGLAIKLGFELYGMDKNYYEVLEVSRHSSVLDIRQAYKQISKKLHPDKNHAANAEEMFQQVKTAYDVLMDESQRDVYNRFGKDSLSFDPRLDELKLLSNIGVVYLFWFVASFIFTIPKATKAARIWIAIIGIAALVLEICLCVTESSLPAWMPATMTEYEVIRRMHSLFPAIIAAFSALAMSLYVDIDLTSINALAELTKHQRALEGMLQQLQVAVTALGDKSNQAAANAGVEQVTHKMSEIREIMEESCEITTNIVDKLKNSSSNPGSNYYWLLFVLMYGGVYFFQ